MITKILQISFIGSALLLQGFHISAQDKRVQYPAFLSNSYINVNIGYINYPFSNLQMEPGFRAESIQIPHWAVRVILLGHHINKYFSVQISYMRPVDWVEYKNVNGDRSNHSVWMNVAGLTIKAQAPVNKKFSVYGEAGPGIITRRGFQINNSPAVKDANYVSFLLGAGLIYHLSKNWDLAPGITYSPAHGKVKQPHTIFFSGGFIYNMHPLSAERVERNSRSGFIFPENLIQLGFTTNALGYGVNNFVSKGAIPIFWSGEAQVERGVSIHYRRNTFHGRKTFSLYWGAGLSWWKSKKNKDEIYTLSFFPVFRFTVVHLKQTDLYFNYSLAGPTFISKVDIDGNNTGKRFTFHDFMGVGAFTGKKRNFNAEIRIAHYSNGNIFPQNVGLMIPLTFNLGYAF